MNNELFNELNVVDEQIGEFEKQIEQLEAKLKAKSETKGMSANYFYYKNIMTTIIDKMKVVKALNNRWCEIFKQIVAGNTLNESFLIVSYDSFESVIEVLKTAEERFLVNAEGKFDPSVDYSNISREFMDYYTDLINQKDDLMIKYYEDKVAEFTNSYTDAIAKRAEKYKIDGTNDKYNIGGATFELNTPQDTYNLIDIIEDYEASLEKDNDLNVELIEPVLLSQASPEIQAKFGYLNEKEENTISLNSGVKVKLKKFVNKGKKAIKLIGSKLVNVKDNLVSNLKAYYSDINVPIENSMDIDLDAKTLPSGTEDIVKSVPEEVSHSEEIVIEQKNDEYGMKEPNILEENVETIETAPIQQNVQVNENLKPNNTTSVDEILEGYVKVENAINNNEELTDDQKKEWRNTLWNDFDNYVNENPEQEVKKENAEKVSVDPLVQVDDNRLAEYELEEYLSKLTLSSEELDELDKRVKDYLHANPDSNEFVATKEALKSMAIALEPEYIKIEENVETKPLEPIVLDSGNADAIQIAKPVYNEETEDTIDKMNETELDEYIRNSNLTMEELERFQELVQGYKQDNPEANNSMAEKACIKLIMDQRELEQRSNTRTSIIESKK